MTLRQKNFIRKWVTELRSRKYKQGTGCLRDSSGSKVLHCCLGVACELKTVEWEGDTAIYEDDYEDATLSDLLRENIGISYKEEEDLVHMNDTGKKFYQIARWLERRFLK